MVSDTPHYENVPYDLPEGWEWQKLGDIGTWQSGATPSRLNKDYYGGDIPWLKTGDLNDDYIYEIPETITQKALEETSVKLNPAGSVLIAMYGATIGKVGILTFPATTNQASCACVDYQGIEKMYLFYFLLSHKEEFIMLGGGGAQPNISKEKIVDTFIPIPPLLEQNRIVNAIEQWFYLIDTLETAKEDLKTSIEHAKSKILDLAIHGKLVPQDSNDEPAIELLKRINPKFTPCDNAHCPYDLPQNWEWINLGKITNYGNCENVDVNDIPTDGWVLELEDLEKDSAKIIQWLSKDERDIKGVRHSFHKGDVLYSKLRTYLNKVMVAPEDGFCTTEIIPVTCMSFIQPEYLNHVLRSKYFVDYTIQCGYGVKMPRLSTTDARNGQIPLPPYNEQLRIVAKIEEFFAVLDEIQKSIEA